MRMAVYLQDGRRIVWESDPDDHEALLEYHLAIITLEMDKEAGVLSHPIKHQKLAERRKAWHARLFRQVPNGSVITNFEMVDT